MNIVVPRCYCTDEINSVTESHLARALRPLRSLLIYVFGKRYYEGPINRHMLTYRRLIVYDVATSVSVNASIICTPGLSARTRIRTDWLDPGNSGLCGHNTKR